MTVAQEAPDDRTRARDLRWWREVIYIVLVYLAYSAVRNQFGSGAGAAVDPDPAFHHAEAIIHIERSLGLYVEHHLQSWYLDLPLNGLIRVWNVYYGILHFVVTAFALVWLFHRARHRYRLWRNTLAATTLLALVGFASFSLMPPRLMDDPGIYGGCQVYADTPPDDLPDRAGEPPCDEYGYVDTIARYGGWASFGSDEMARVSNQYAAMPSMHIGWSAWCVFVLVPLLRRRWLRALVVAYPVVTLFDIIVTGNHWWIDGPAGLACLGLGYLVALAATRWYERRRGLQPVAAAIPDGGSGTGPAGAPARAGPPGVGDGPADRRPPARADVGP
ncbi:MAG TPA: phosphatase PAP2 family protein [Acidimicrobiales bacterium]